MANAIAREHTFFGRERELASLAELTARVAYIHGIAGIGKSSLLDELVARLRASGGTVLALDCHTIEPTERGLLLAAGAALGVGST
jgi:putative protein kinase ArgK-like GTPase of G3E family